MAMGTILLFEYMTGYIQINRKDHHIFTIMEMLITLQDKYIILISEAAIYFNFLILSCHWMIMYPPFCPNQII